MSEDIYFGVTPNSELGISAVFGTVDAAKLNRLKKCGRMRLAAKALDRAAHCQNCGHCEDRPRAADAFIGPDSRTVALDVLKELRPVIARSKDAALRAAFTAILQKHTRSSKPSTASYGAFAAAATARDAQPDGESRYASLQRQYDAVRRGEASMEVK